MGSRVVGDMNEIILEIRINNKETAKEFIGQLKPALASKSLLASYEAFVYSASEDRLVLVFHGPLCRVNLAGYIIWLKGFLKGKFPIKSNEKPAFQILADYSSGKLYEQHRAGALPASRPDPFKYGKEWRKYLSQYMVVFSGKLFADMQDAFKSQFPHAALWVKRKGADEKHRVVVWGQQAFFGMVSHQSGELPSINDEEAWELMQALGEEDETDHATADEDKSKSKMPLLLGIVVVLAILGVGTWMFISSKQERQQAPKPVVKKDLKEILQKEPEETTVPEVETVPEPQLVPLPPVRAEMSHPKLLFKKKWKKRIKKEKAEKAVAMAEGQKIEEVKKETTAEETKAEEEPQKKEYKGPKITAAQYWKKKKAIKTGQIDPEIIKQEVEAYAETGSIFLAKLKVVADNMIIDKKMKKLKEMPADDPNYAVMRRKLEEEEISDVLTFQIHKRPDVLRDFGRKCEVDEVSQFLFNLAYLEYTKKKYYNHKTFRRIASAIDPSAKRAKGSGKPVLDITYFVNRCYKKNSSPEHAKKLTHILIVSLYYLEHVYYSYVKTKPPARLKKVEQKVYQELEKMIVDRNITPDPAYFDELVLSVVSYFQRYREVPLNEGPLLNKIRVACWKKPEVSRYCKF